MPRYYFHIHRPGSRLIDEDGSSLPDEEAAWYQAVRSVRELITAQDLPGGCWAGQAVQIEDERGVPVAQIPFQEIATYALC